MHSSQLLLCYSWHAADPAAALQSTRFWALAWCPRLAEQVGGAPEATSKRARCCPPDTARKAGSDLRTLQGGVDVLYPSFPSAFSAFGKYFSMF